MNRDCNRSGTSFEALEGRRMYSAALRAGTVFIEETNANETVTVSEIVVNDEFLPPNTRFLKVTETTHRALLPDITRTTTFRKSLVSKLRVNAFGGNDVVTLNTTVPADVFGGAGNDRITGGSGNDNLFGDLSILQGFDGEEIGPGFRGTQGSDVILGNAGNDRIEGHGANDVLRGGAGNDNITGGAGFDQMFGDADNDIILARDGVGNELVDGGTGLDSARIDFQHTTNGPVVDDARNLETLV
jgi:Ca2+-binding RTX toxin-like protein